VNKKILKKLKDKEEKLIDVIYEIVELLESTEDAELCSMGDMFSESLQEYIIDNDTMNLQMIKEYIENEYDG
jgi:hypothetical protein